MSNAIYGQRSVWCGICHRAPGKCTCQPLYPLVTKLTSPDLRRLLIAARAGVVEWQGIAYALTWDAGEGGVSAAEKTRTVVPGHRYYIVNIDTQEDDVFDHAHDVAMFMWGRDFREYAIYTRGRRFRWLDGDLSAFEAALEQA